MAPARSVLLELIGPISFVESAAAAQRYWPAALSGLQAPSVSDTLHCDGQHEAHRTTWHQERLCGETPGSYPQPTPIDPVRSPPPSDSADHVSSTSRRSPRPAGSAPGYGASVGTNLTSPTVESATGRSRHAEAPKVHVERPADIRKDDLASPSCSATARVFPPGERVKPVISGLGGHEMPGYQKPRRGSTVLPSSGGGYEAAGRKTNTHF